MERRERVLAVALLALGLNSVYLAARADASLFYFGNVVLHVALGLGTAAALGRRVRRHWTALDAAWLATVAVHRPRPFLFLAEGLFMYFTAAQVKALVLALRVE